MAATVEGAFILVDRASGPARRIRHELRELQLQAERTGRTMDGSIGTPRQARTLDQTAREMHVLGQETGSTSSAMGELGRESDRTERKVKGLGTQVRTLGITLRAVGAIIGVMKWPALIAGVGGATQAVTGLLAGAVALLPALTDLGGVAIGLVPVYGGLAGGIGAVALAMGGLSQAAGGNREALKRLTPEARAFLEVLRETQTEIRSLRRISQRELFPSLDQSLRLLTRQRQAIREIIRQQASDMGNLAVFGARRIARPEFMRELVALSDQSARAFGAVARGGLLLAEALVHVTRAAAPFTDWLARSFEHMGRWAERAAYVGMQTGSLERYFDRTRKRLEQFGRIGSDVFGALRGTMRAARGEGDSFWKAIERGADRWDRWANSFRGQTEMRRFFYEMRPVISETVGLIGDLAKALADIGRGPEGAIMIRELRQAVPVMASAIREITKNFGPGVVRALGQFLGLIAELAQPAGALTLFVSSLGTLAEVATAAVGALGPLGNTIVMALGASMLMRRVDVLNQLAGAIRGVGRASRDVGAAPLVVGGAIPSPAVAGAGAGTAGRAAAPGTMATTPTGIILPGGSRPATPTGLLGPDGRPISSGTAATRAGGAGLIARSRARLGAGIAAARAPGSAAGAARGAGRFMGPTMALMGIMGAAGTQGGLPQRAQGALSALSLGVISAPVGQAAKEQNAAAEAAKRIGALPEGGSRRVQTRAIGELETSVRLAPGNDALGEANADPKAYTNILKSELKMRRQLLRETIQMQEQELAEASVKHARTLMRDFGRAFDIRAKNVGPAAAMDRMVGDVLTKMRHMNPAGAKVLGENVIAWARQQARSNPKLLGQVERLEDGIKRSFSRTRQHVQIVNGRILTGSQREWSGIAQALMTQTERARQEVSKDFTDMQEQAVGSLRSMGLSPSQARRLVQAEESGGKRGRTARRLGKQGTSSLGLGAAEAHGYSPIGDGVGDGPGSFAGGAGANTANRRSGSSGLMGADPDLGRYASIGGEFGLHVSSGARPGAITSYGNQSFHASGDAIDVAGDAGAMMRYARYMIDHFGPGLEELIYTPLGFSIKNGKRVSPIAANDHFDHVHVADVDPKPGAGGAYGLSMDTAGPGMFGLQIPPLEAQKSAIGGLPGAASELSSAMYAAALTKKLNDALAGGQGVGGDMGLMPGAAMPSGGGTLSYEQIAQLAAQVGFPNPGLVAAIALAESGGRVGVVNSIGATGLMQILTSAHPQYDPARLASDPLYNMQAAYNISSGGSNFGPWEAFTKGMHTQYLRGDGQGAQLAQSAAIAHLLAAVQQPRTMDVRGPQITGPLVSIGKFEVKGGGDERRTAIMVRRELDRFSRMIVEELSGAGVGGAM